MDKHYTEIILILREVKYITGELFSNRPPEITQLSKDEITDKHIKDLITFKVIAMNVFKRAFQRLKHLLDILRADSISYKPKINHFLNFCLSKAKEDCPDVATLEEEYQNKTVHLAGLDKVYRGHVSVESVLFEILFRMQQAAQTTEDAFIDSLKEGAQSMLRPTYTKRRRMKSRLLPSQKELLPATLDTNYGIKPRHIIMRMRYKSIEDFRKWNISDAGFLQKKLEMYIEALKAFKEGHIKCPPWRQPTSFGGYVHLLKPAQPEECASQKTNKMDKKYEPEPFKEEQKDPQKELKTPKGRPLRRCRALTVG